MSFWWVILVIVIMLVIVYMGSSNKAKERKEKQDSFIKEQENEGVILSNKTDIENGIIAIDKNREKIVYIDDKGDTLVTKEFSFSDIIACELIKDGETIYKKSATRTIGGAIVGGVLSGGVGAIIGGLSGSAKEKEKINSIDIKITLRDIDTPNFKFNFFEYKGTRMFLDLSIKSAEEWKDRITAIIEIQDSKK
ncbi:hypothetical protein [Parabacteroides pacaensis]|uniref:hypothetical protein n=1 Tax=Parabacteroides pacaensis TaxID=2086575 RepID=UPI00131B802F|nr:hypothetical protein [Parabacteroides pacaensis]